MCQGCGFDHRSGHIQKSTSECINKWNNKSMFLSLSLPPFLSLQKKKKSIKTMDLIGKMGSFTLQEMFVCKCFVSKFLYAHKNKMIQTIN